MHRTRISTLVLSAVVSTAASWAVVRVLSSRGVLLPAVPWVTVGVLVLIAGVVLALGWSVRQYLRGKRPGLDPIRAARTVVLAKATCCTGALLLGWYVAQALEALADLEIAAQRARALSAGLAVLGAAVMTIAGVVVERFCQIPPPEDPEKTGASHDPTPGAATG